MREATNVLSSTSSERYIVKIIRLKRFFMPELAKEDLRLLNYWRGLNPDIRLTFVLSPVFFSP